MISSIHIVSQAGHLPEVILALNEMPGVEVHRADIPSSRAIATVDSGDLEEQESMMAEIRRLQWVLAADLVFLYDAEA